MSIRCERFRPEHLEAFAKLARVAFADRPNTPEFLHWRYLELTEQFGEVAFDGEDCVAMCWGFVRPYVFRNHVARVIEVQDWYCLPDYRGQKTGVALIQRAMEREEPTLTFGGSEHTVAILPKLRWTHLGDAQHYALPLSARVWRARSRVGSLGRPLDSATRWWFRPRPRQPKGAEMVSERLAGAAPQPDLAADPEAAAPLISSEMARWLTAGAQFCGSYYVHRFLVDRAERGWALCRTVDAEGKRLGIILRVQLREPSPDMVDWVLAELVRQFAAQDVDAVRIAAASGELAAAVRRLRFFHRGSSPIHSYQHGKATSFSRVAAGYDVSDKLLLPLAEGSRR